MQTVDRALGAVRALRAVWWFAVGLAVAWVGMVPEGYAETIPATGSGPVARWRGARVHGATGNTEVNFYEGASAAEVGAQQCAYRASTLSPPQSGTFTSYNTSYTRADCTFSSWGFPSTGGALVQYCPTGTASGSHGSMVCSGGTTYSCPATGGWTLSGTNCTRADCPAGQTRNATTGACEVDCASKAGKAPDSNVPGYDAGIIGWYAAGASSSAWAAGSACYGGCRVEAPHSKCTKGGSDPLVYNCGMAGASYTGAACNGTEGAAAAATGTESAEDKNKKTTGYDCLKAGMSAGTVGTTVVCHESPTTSSTSTKTTSSTPGSGTGGSTTTETTRTDCEGEKCTTTTSSSTTSGGTGPGGTGSGSSTTPGAVEKEEEAKDDYCRENPDAAVCGKDEAGPAAGTDGLYTKGSRTVAQSFGDFKTSVAAAPFYSAAAGYFSAGGIPGGSCSGLETDVAIMASSFHIDLASVLCGSMAAGFYAVLGIGMMLAAGWVAFRIAIL